MLAYLKSEHLKYKHHFCRKSIWLMPMVTVLITFFLMGGDYVQMGAYNWWYILILPFTITYIATTFIQNEKAYLYHGLFTVVKEKEKLWYAKIILAILYISGSCLFFAVLIMLMGMVFKMSISGMANGLACLLLVITFMWQMPLMMFLALKVNTFILLIISIGLNIYCACWYGITPGWYVPFAIPARLMCPILKMAPNGLAIDAASHLLDTSVILPGVGITILLVVGLSVVTARAFRKVTI